MADAKWTALTENTSPLGTDIMAMVDDPGGTPASQKITITNLMTRAPLTLDGGCASFNPADATTYYFGSMSSLAAATGANTRRLYAMRAGTITAVDLYVYLTAGTAETSTIYLRKNNTTDTTLSSAIALNGTVYHELVTGLSITAAAGDYFEFKWTAATYATNPTNVIWVCQIMLS